MTDQANHAQAQRKTRRPFVMTAILMAMFMAAIEATIVATSMPSIVAKLGGISLYSWVFSGYLLMQAVSVPIYGKLSDLFGRKPIFIIGIVIFLTGSVLSGLAWSMEALIGFRILQGLGAGAVLPLAITLIGDLYTLEERGRVQGYTSAVWGLSSIIGPLAGALIVQYANWSWVFWVNVPFGLVAIFLVVTWLHEDVVHKQPKIDYGGALLLLVTLSTLMLAVTHASDWSVTALGGLLAVTVVSAALFIWQERRAPEPVMNLALWSNPLMMTANVATLASGIAMVGVISFLPTFIQGALGTTALIAGFTLSGMSIGWPLAATLAGHNLVRMGVRRWSRIGGVFVFGGAMVLALFASAGPVVAGIAAFILGCGLGTLNTTFIVAIQTTVPWAQRGAATASNLLMRILGNSLGAAIFGGVLNTLLLRNLNEKGLAQTFSIDSVQGLLGNATHVAPVAGGADKAAELLNGPAGEALRTVLASSLHGVFWGVAVAGLVTVLMTFRMQEVKLEKDA